MSRALSPSARAFHHALRSDFLTFLGKAVATLSEGSKLEPNWHLEAIGHRLSGIERDGGARLIINVPPRSLKSVTVSVAWVAYMLGRNPQLKFVCISYSHDLALKHARDCRTLMQTDWYRSAFPRTVLARTAEQDLVTTAGGGRYSTSVGGTLTGLGGDIIIIDDPIKPDEADSEAARANVLEWFGGTLSSRLDSKVRGSIVLVMQRVHQDDLAGHLLEGGGWDLLSLPAIAKADEEVPIGPDRVHSRRTGDLLHPEREPQAELDRLKAAMGSLTFQAQYQQAPIPAEGNLVKAHWFKRFATPPVRRLGDTVIQSWDCATNTGDRNDWSVCITALSRGDEIYILDVYRARLEFPDLHKQVLTLARKHQPDALLIEAAGSGLPLIQILKQTAPKRVRPIAIKAHLDKQVRLNRPSVAMEAGDVHLPEDAHWLGEFMTELLGFPRARHDDQVDALSQLINWDLGRSSDSIPAGAIEVPCDGSFPMRSYGPLGEDDEDPMDGLYGLCVSEPRWP